MELASPLPSAFVVDAAASRKHTTIARMRLDLSKDEIASRLAPQK